MEVRYSTVELWPYLQAAWRQLSRFLKTKNESKLNKNQTKSEKVNRTNLNQRTHRITERKDWQQICESAKPVSVIHRMCFKQKWPANVFRLRQVKKTNTFVPSIKPHSASTDFADSRIFSEPRYLVSTIQIKEK